MEGPIVTLASLPTTSFMRNNLHLVDITIGGCEPSQNLLKVVELVLMDFL
jgi:hypothetical protein